MKLSHIYKLLHTFVRQNVPIVLFVGIVFFVGIIVLFKLVTAQEETVYVKVKVSQGLWWASTQKPSGWYVSSFKKGDTVKNLSGKPIAEIVGVRYYAWSPTLDQYDIYVNLKLQTSKNKNTGVYYFNRSPLTIASPIEIDFPTVFLGGTIMDISSNPFPDIREERIVTLTKKAAYEWEYDSLIIGDTYFDGTDTMLEIIDKTARDTSMLQSDVWGNYPAYTEQMKYITVKAKVKVQNQDGKLILGEEYPLIPGVYVRMGTNNYVFDDYKVSHIEYVK